MAKHKAPAPAELVHHDRLGTVFHHLHKALLELELLLREEAARQEPEAAPAATAMPRWISVPKAAKELGVGRASIYAMVTRKELPVFRIGRLIRVRLD